MNPRIRSLLHSLLLFCLLVGAAPAAPLRLLEERDAWGWAKREWETTPTFRVFWIKSKNGTVETPVLRIRATLPAWDTTLGRSFVLAEEPAVVRLRGRMRVEKVVAGVEPFMSARAQVTFHDAEGERIGGWPAGELVSGTRDWFTFEQTHRPPAGTRGVGLTLGLVNSSGLVEFADLELEVLDQAGNSIAASAPPEEERTDTRAWWVFHSAPAAPDDDGVHIGHLFTREAAGARGRVLSRDGDLVFADGSPVRFWGTNVAPPATWPEPEAGARMAEALARSGVNLVRLHHMDRGWHADNIFEADVPHTQSFDAAKLDRLHRFTAELRKRGIYIAMDLMVTRRFRPDDGVEAYGDLEFGGKMAAHFDERILQLQEDYARRLLSTRNPYTGLAYAEDPAIAFVSIINESSLYLNGAISSYQKLPPVYRQRLLDAFARRQNARGLELPAGDVLALFNRREPDFWNFLRETQDAGYDRLTRFLREDLKVQGLIGGSNFIEFADDLHSNARLDFIDVHVYWDHPVGGWSELNSVSNRSVIPALAGANPFRQIALQNAKALPLAISEWQACWPNEHLAEFPPLMAAIGGLQGWDAPMWFTFEGHEPAPLISGVFSADNKPHLRVSGAFASIAFRRGDFSPLPARVSSYANTLPWESVNSLASEADVLTERLLWSSGPASTKPAKEGRAGSVVVADRATALLSSPRTAAVVGRALPRPAAAGALTVASRTPFSVIGVTSLTDAPIERANRLLLLAVARMENTGQVFRGYRKGLRSGGVAPILAEPVRATLLIERANEKSLQLVPLDVHGRPAGAARPLSRDAQGRVRVELDGEQWLWAELVAVP